MNRIDDLIANPGVYYDDQAVEGWIAYCETELTLTDGSDLNLLDSFKVWGEQVFGWYYFVERMVYDPEAHKKLFSICLIRLSVTVCQPYFISSLFFIIYSRKCLIAEAEIPQSE